MEDEHGVASVDEPHHVRETTTLAHRPYRTHGTILKPHELHPAIRWFKTCPK